MILTPDEIAIFNEMREKLLKMPKYNPAYHPNEKTSERDFHTMFINVIADEKSKFSPVEWSLLQEHLFEKFFKNGGLTVKELEKLETKEENNETTSNVFTKAARKRMIEESKLHERGIPMEKETECEHSFTIVNDYTPHRQENIGDSDSDIQPSLPIDSNLKYISNEQRRKELELENENQKNINKNMILR